MTGPQRWVLVLAMGAQGCAIIALVGENRDAGFDVAAVDAPMRAPDVVAPPADAPALPDDVPPPVDAPAPPDAGPPAMDVAFVTDVPFVFDARLMDRPGSQGAGQDVVDATDAGDDVVVRADASATADAGMTVVEDSAALEDASQLLPDALVGASCRRDSDCARDPAGMLCGTMTMRCGTVR